VFNVPFQGGLGSLAAITLAFIAASLSLGLLISTLAKTQLQAMQMTVFILLPSILLSGFMFPYDAMPTLAQYIAEAFPATHFIRLIRGVVLRGADAGQLLPDITWLVVFTAVTLTVATVRFNKTLD
jgi:ABC-2 type transport system permease protein